MAQTAEQADEFVDLPDKLIPVFLGKADVRGAYGGRGSAKTRSFAIMSAVRAYIWDRERRNGIILVARQYLNSLDDSSLEEIKIAIQETPWLEPFFDIGEKYIKTKSGRISYKFSGLDRNIASIKSKSRILLCWVDEAEPVTESAWITLIPTLREEDSELWVTWNPERKGSPVDKRFRGNDDPLYKIAEMNWRDNDKFPAKLERERQRDKRDHPEEYDHIWEGGYKRAHVGAYWAKAIVKAREDNRIGRVGPDPLMKYRMFADLGGTGAKSDAFALWVSQFVGKEDRVLDYYEAVGQPIAAHLQWMHKQGYEPENSSIWLPHDGETNDRVYDVSFESAFKKAGYTVEVVPNQGKGAARQRIEAAHRTWPNVWMDEAKCQVHGGLDALSFYHEKKDENRDVGLGPDHDWSSHAADAWGLKALVYEKHHKEKPKMTDPYKAFR